MVRCIYCEKQYKTKEEARKCRDSHNLIYVPFAPEDLNRVVNYMYNPDMRILKGTPIVRVLQRYLRVAYEKTRKTSEEDMSDM